LKNWLPPLASLKDLVDPLALLRAVVLVLIGFVIAGFVARAIRSLAARRLAAQQTLLLRRITYYLILSLFLVAAMHQVGFEIGVLVGAAGILTMALGFASQTSVANLVSGLFLIAEGPFGIGDVIKVGGTSGEVLSIDLLSVKLRTFDNLYVRIPNESLIKTEVRTLTKFPIRRAEIEIGVAYKEDIERVRELLFEVAESNVLCLDEPKPVFIFQAFGDSAVQIRFLPWALQENYLELKNSLQQEVKVAFEHAGIEIPYPHQTVQIDGEIDPFPVRVIDA
jgi:small-conductance mechanosensitive channel